MLGEDADASGRLTPLPVSNPNAMIDRTFRPSVVGCVWSLQLKLHEQDPNACKCCT